MSKLHDNEQQNKKNEQELYNRKHKQETSKTFHDCEPKTINESKYFMIKNKKTRNI